MIAEFDPTDFRFVVGTCPSRRKSGWLLRVYGRQLLIRHDEVFNFIVPISHPFSLGEGRGDPDDSTSAGRARARAVLDAMLAAARAGGFGKTDILETLLARNVATKRVGEMAAEACAAAGHAAVREIFDSLRKG